MNHQTAFRDLFGFTVDQIADNVLRKLERWRLADSL